MNTLTNILHPCEALQAVLRMGCLLLLWITPGVSAQTLVGVDDDYGIPFGQTLQVEALGVLENDILNGDPAGENGGLAELLSSTSSGTLSCPTDPALELCADGSFDYTPGSGFTGSDSFTYQASYGGVISAPVTVNLTACTGGPPLFACWKEIAYLSKLAELGYGVFNEGFEGVAWNDVRTAISDPNTAASIISQGITWTTNHPETNNITTSSGAARSGNWGGYDANHGSATGSDVTCDVDDPLESCLYYDGLSGKAQLGGAALHGVGAYIDGTYGAKMVAIIDGGTPISLGRMGLSEQQFHGVIDARSSGFSEFEFREVDGKIGQRFLVFFDDFIIASNEENIAPTLSIDAPSATDTTVGPVTYAITYSGADTVNLTGADVMLNKTGTANSTVTVTDGATSTPTVTISSILGDGTLSISIGAGTASDAAGNYAAAVGPGGTFNVDNMAPIVDIQGEPISVNSTAAFGVTIEFSEGVTGFVVGDISVVNGSAGAFSTTDANTYTASITPDGNGDITIDVAASMAQDAASNGNTAAPRAVVTYDDPPVFTSAVYFSFSNNDTAVGQVTASDDENDSITFSLVGGVDQALFTITPGGVLSFIQPPDIENPADQDRDNEYLVTVQAFDGSNTAEQSLTIGTDEKPCSFFIIPIPEKGSAVVFCL